MPGASTVASSRDEADTQRAERRADQPAQGGQEQPFREQAADDAGTARAHRRAHGNLALASGVAGQQQVRDVDAHDEEHGGDRREEDAECGAQRAHRLVLHAVDLDARHVHRHAAGGDRSEDRLSDRRGLLLRRFDRDTGPESPDQREAGTGVGRAVAPIEWHEEGHRLAGEGEVRRHHPDHGHRPGVPSDVQDLDRLADDSAIGLKELAPDVVREYQHVRPIVVTVDQRATQQRRGS